MSAALVRTFIAVEIPQPMRVALESAVAPLREAERLRWTQPAGWHLTLKFLGEVTAPDVKRVTSACEKVAAGLHPFHTALGGWGAFPSPQRPRVLWVGIEQGADELIAAAEALDNALPQEEFHREDKVFHPHLTIARIEDPIAGKRALAAAEAHPFISERFAVDRLVLFQSVLDQRGAQYHPLAVCPFTET
jgi:2'-5' RNA ligase